MAGVRFGGGIIQMSGSIGGTVFARNRSGNYARARTTPVNPNTDRQDAVRSAIAFLSDRWAAVLTAPQRAAWNLYGDSVNMKNRLGEVIHLSGYNHYIRSNTIAKLVPYPLIDAGPVVFELPAQDPTLAFTASEATQILTIAYDDTMAWATEDAAYIYFFQGKPQNAQRNFFGGPWRLLGSVTGIDPGGPVEPHAGTAVFAIAEGQAEWIYARIQRADGRLSEKFRAGPTLVAA